ncbi:DAO-domain-containing protein [Rhizopus microsporus var. microsporus]|uniref:L-2-hydroxyglutarate dehydrogenase, mitochondrial n=2 Tax=Rhizopus microsporus TaxID=58291 RepID=A0A2G4SI99_RHIZD|nr:DAO-domain-containing protein [Rhizopus microsporus ATCC 52813]ORE05519.1 DAO-domain-containing protein [Rhizopus microsporus var. microsporus]PHZ08507.1 DAO-domain-containing protein [Rhizopus microsporus ATCC 52813]
MFARSSRLFQRRYLMVAGAVATSTGVILLQTRKAHAESNQLKFWKSLPGENTPENPGLAKLRGMAAEQRFRTSLAQNNGKTDFDVVIVGGGIIGLATARELLKRFPNMTVAVLEKEREVAAHQTGHNSGVIHAGIYYKPGSRMAKTCVRGADLMYEYCKQNQLPVERCGKLIVAVDEKEHKQIERLMETATLNGVKDLQVLNSEEIKQLEPNVVAYSALYSPNTGITDFGLVAQCIANEIVQTGRAEIKLAFEAKKFESRSDGRVEIWGGEPNQKGPVLKVTAKNVITCAGFYSDRVAALAGGDPKRAKVVTFRGTYYQLKPEYRGICRMNVYPVPSGGGIPVGVHFTPTVNARRGIQMIIGPGACLTFSREGYQFSNFKWEDVFGSLTNLNLWMFALKNPSLSIGELYKDMNKRAFLRAAQAYVPGLTEDMVEESFAGVMSQVFEEGGVAANDYILERKVMDGKILCVRNAPTPACTASLAIAEMLIDVATEDFEWQKEQEKKPEPLKVSQAKNSSAVAVAA